MRIAYCVRAIYPQHGFGGLERSATSLMERLLARGVDMALFTQPLPPGEPVRTGGPGKLAVHTQRYGRWPLPPNGIPARLTNYRQFVERIGKRVEGLAWRGHLDGVYAHGLCAWGVRRASTMNIPLIANPHGLEEFKVRHPIKRLLYTPFRAWVRGGCRAADRVVATDKSMAGEVARLLRIDPARVVVIPNGVDAAALRQLADPALRDGLAARFPLIDLATGPLGISVGRMEDNKGFHHLLDALARAAARGVHLRWLFAGEGSQRAALQSQAKRLGLGQSTTFTGGLSDQELHTLYAMCDLFAHPTLYEGSSLVTLEAMAHGLPVVASAVGGIPDKVMEGETGFLVPPGDDEPLADRLQWLADHPLEARIMGERGARSAEEEFSWERSARLTLELMEELAAARCA